MPSVIRRISMLACHALDLNLRKRAPSPCWCLAGTLARDERSCGRTQLTEPQLSSRFSRRGRGASVEGWISTVRRTPWRIQAAHAVISGWSPVEGHEMPRGVPPGDSSGSSAAWCAIARSTPPRRTILQMLGLCASALLLCREACGVPVAVRYHEATAHGFVVVHSDNDQRLAAGEMTQTTNGARVTARLTLHFKDGSLYDETTVYSQDATFHLLTNHVRERGPTFPKPTDEYIEVQKGEVSLSEAKDGGGADVHHVEIPDDAANGLMLVLLKNLVAPALGTTVSMVAVPSKPRIIKLKIHSEGHENFEASGYIVKAVHFVVHTEIGGVAGLLASVTGKQPPDIHVWLTAGAVPTFVKFRGPLYEQGPIWTVELSPVRSARAEER